MSRDLRKYVKGTNARLLIGAFASFFIIGVGLIWLIYGPNAALMGFLCLLGALVPIVLIFLLFLLSDWILKRAGRD